MSSIGKKTWIISGGHIPLHSTGHEPEFTSRDQLAVLNTGEEDADLKLTVFFSKSEAVGPFKVKIQARRLRKIRFNDLIDPQALPLGEDYGCVVDADKPVVVQFSRMNTGQPALATIGTMAFSGEE